MMRQMAPAASGVLIDAYYGAWPAIATERHAAAHKGMLVRVEKSGSPQEQGRRPDGRDRAGLERREDQAHGRRRRQAARALRARRARLRRAPVLPDPARSTTSVKQVRHPDAPGARGLPLRRREEDRPGLRRPQGRDRHRERPPDFSQFCDVYKAEFPGTLGTDSDDQLTRQRPRPVLRQASVKPWVLLSAGVDYDRVLQAGPNCDGVRLPPACWAAGPSGRSTSSRTAPRPAPSSPPPTGLKRVSDVGKVVVQKHGTPWFARYGLTKPTT